ncbi:MAG TPA: 6-phosphogluconolactonase [Dermatophilaceae bacterium]|nr:6-phosphogluconolactonase [Dermatophilaceae bacterium]
MPEPLVVRHPSTAALRAAAGARLVTAVLDACAARGEASVVLTGGSLGSALLAAAREAPSSAAVDWRRVSWWWGDERFLEGGHPERNDTQNGEAFLDHVDVDPARVHPVPGPGSPHGGSPEEAAAEYAKALAEAADGPAASPLFDVVLLGVGPDGHVASLFPGHPVLGVSDVAAAAVHDSPKPPPDRVTLTFPTLNRARAVWYVVGGADKATAVARGVGGDDVSRTPAGHVRGLEHTLWLVDADAARGL